MKPGQRKTKLQLLSPIIPRFGGGGKGGIRVPNVIAGIHIHKTDEIRASEIQKNILCLEFGYNASVFLYGVDKVEELYRVLGQYLERKEKAVEVETACL